MKLAVVLFNLGAPDSLDAVEPFLRNLFSDRAILPLPDWLRRPAASLIAKRRRKTAQAIYRHIGGRSPLLEETEAQAAALERALCEQGLSARVFVSMRTWHPMSGEAAAAVNAYAPDEIVLLPLYPQYSTTTSGSSVVDWQDAATSAGLSKPQRRVCCYPWEDGFVDALAEKLETALARRKPNLPYRVLFSAHGLPQRTVRGGDPYQWQIEQTAAAVVRRLGDRGLDWRIAYQSRVGPLKWLEPATDAEILRAGRQGNGVVVAPIAFVSEHSETLVELDIEYARIARESGVADYIRVPTVGTSKSFIAGLAGLVLKAVAAEKPVTCGDGRLCPARFSRCGMSGELA